MDSARGAVAQYRAGFSWCMYPIASYDSKAEALAAERSCSSMTVVICAESAEQQGATRREDDCGLRLADSAVGLCEPVFAERIRCNSRSVAVGALRSQGWKCEVFNPVPQQCALGCGSQEYPRYACWEHGSYPFLLLSCNRPINSSAHGC